MEIIESGHFQPCTVRSDEEMACTTPELILPSVEEYGNFTAEYRFGFILDGVEEYREISKEKHNISIVVEVVHLSTVEVHNWPPYDSSSGEPLELKVRQQC